MGLSYGQTASLGQGIEGIGNAISNIFDPRIAAAANQSRIAQEAAQMEMKYKPQLFQSQIAQNQASAGAAGAAANLHNVQAEAARQRAAYGQQALNIPVPQGEFPGVPYAADVKTAPSPQAMQDYQNAVALRLNAYGGGNSDQYAQSVARIAGLNAQDEMAARRAQLGVTGQLPNVNQAFTTDTQGKVIAAQGMNDVAKQAETNKGNTQQEFIRQGMQGIFPSAGSGLNQTAGNLNIKDLEAIDKYVQGKFTLPGGELSPDNYQAASAYSNTLKTLMGQGIPSADADRMAAAYHGGAEYSNGLLSSEKMQPSKGFVMTPIPIAKAAEMGYQFKNEQAQNQFGLLAQRMNILGGMTGGQPTGLPIPAPPAPNQEAPPAVPATGAAPTRTGPITLGEKATAKKAEEKRQKDLAYNKKTMERLIPLAQANGVDLNQIFATALAGGQENQAALGSALYQTGGAMPAAGVAMQSAPQAPSLTDIQNALRSSAIQSQYGIDPNLVNQYLPQGNAGQTQIGRFIVNQ